MGVLDFTDKACDTYTGYSYDAYKQLRGLGNLTRGPYNEAARRLRKIKGGIPSPSGLVNSALYDLENDLYSAIPDMSDFDVISDIITKCTPLKNLLNGTGSLTDAVDYMADMVSNLANDVFGNALSGIMSGISEYLPGLNILNVDDLFGSLRLPNILSGLDGLLDCISNMCPGPGTDDIIWAVQQLQDDMLFTDDGKFDSGALMDQIGISGLQRTNISVIGDSMVAMREVSQVKMDNQIKTLFNNVAESKKAQYLGKISPFF